MPSVTVLIPNWNGEHLLAEFLPSAVAAARRYRDQSGDEVEVIVIDDASTDGSLGWLDRNPDPLMRVIARRKNGGFVRAVNEGFLAARSDLVYLLNNDVRVEEDAIAPLVAHFDDPGVFAVCSKAYRLGTGQLDGAGKVGRFSRGFWRVYLNYDILPTRLQGEGGPFYSFFASGGYVIYDRAKLQQFGGFSDLLAPIYWEDVDICYRAWKRGWTVHYEPASVVHHKSSATMGKKVYRRRMKVITERNRLIMTWVNLHDRAWLASHVCWLAVKLLGATVSLDLAYWRSVSQALARLSAIRRLRQRERAASVLSDRDLASVFETLTSKEWTDVIADESDYQRHVRLRQSLEGEAASQH